MHRSYICLGSNMADSEKILQQACAIIDAEHGLTIEAASPIYCTEPQGMNAQNWFLNQVIRLQCTLSWTSSALMECLLRVEKELGRTRRFRQTKYYESRTLDIDILLFNEEKNDNPFVTLPHPRMFERAFVLIPLRHVFLRAQEGEENTVWAKIENSLANLPYTLEGTKIYQS